mgnify:CR=1 FL=1
MRKCPVSITSRHFLVSLLSLVKQIAFPFRNREEIGQLKQSKHFRVAYSLRLRSIFCSKRSPDQLLFSRTTISVLKMRSLIFLACVLMLVRLVASENEGKSISHQWKPSPQSFFDALFYLLEFVRSVASFFGNLVSALYFLLHAIVIASCELISSIFSYVKHAVKLLEFLVVSAWNTSPQLLELLYSIMGSIFRGIEYLGKSIITFSKSVCNQLIPISKLLFYRIQTLLSTFGQNTLTLVKAIFWAISETFSTLITCSTSIYNQLIPISKSLLYNFQVLLRVFGQNILTMLNAIFWAISETFSTLIKWSSSVCNQMIPFSKWLLCGIQAFLFAIGQNTLTMLNAIFWAISETCATLITCSTSIYNQLIPFSKWLLHGIQALLCAIGQNTLTVLNTIFRAIGETFSTLIVCSSSVCNQLTLFSKWLLYSIQALLFVFGENMLNVLNTIFWATSVIFSPFITELGRRYINCIETLPNVASLALHYSLNIGRWTVMVLALVGSFLIHCCVGVNVFSMTFKLLKALLQGVLAFFASFQVTSFPRQEKTTDEHKEPGHLPKDDRYLALMEQLEREREQNLCIVCQTEMKNIVLMPCRHMCMCKNCCAQLFRTQRYQRKTCPLCRNIITSTMEIYA